MSGGRLLCASSFAQQFCAAAVEFSDACFCVLAGRRITVSPEGNMTLMTTAQIGDWDHDTTGPPKDLYVTGDVHVGKTNGSLFVRGDIMVSLGQCS